MLNRAETKIATPVLTSKVKILVIEDEPPVAMMMVFLLTRAGCEVQSAWDGEKGLKLAQSGDFDLITSDIDMPGVGGFELCSRLKQHPHLRDTPVVFISGRIFEEDQQRAFELGAVDYITKPFDAITFPSRLLSHIRRLNGEK